MSNEVEKAAFVIVIATEKYAQRFAGKAPSGAGLGASWEGAIITQDLYERSGRNEKFIPAAFSGPDLAHVPPLLRPYTHFRLDTEDGYSALYRLITAQPEIVPAAVGRVRHLDGRTTLTLEALLETPTVRDYVRVAFSYSHKDEELRDQLETHLKLLQRQGVISTWHDRKILGGEDWAGVIDDNFKRADLILLLVSADFLASDYCYQTEMGMALEREAKGEARVVPVILRACDWKGAPFGKLQGFPKDMKPVTSWPNRDEAWTDVAAGIRKVAEQLRARTR